FQSSLVVENTNRSKVYGEILSDEDFAGSITGVVENDDITLTRSSTGEGLNANVGDYPIVATLTDPDRRLENYTLTNPNGTLSVTKASLVVENTNRSKVYGEILSDEDFAGSITGVVENDDIALTRSSTVVCLNVNVDK